MKLLHIGNFRDQEMLDIREWIKLILEQVRNIIGEPWIKIPGKII